MLLRNKISFALIIISLICLYPGLTNPILTLEIGAELPLIGKMTFYERTQNIVETIETLFQEKNEIVAILILFFSIIVPLLKAVILLIVLFFKQIKNRLKLYRFVYAIGKWSMADVFVVGVFLAYLATKSNEGIHAELESGFYYFTAYCLISLASIQVMSLKEQAPNLG
ncbi:paraquat-inducible protein A [Fulvivirgaceae bacterium BMA12]|uniref:Paraquat-inducible protein A n=1 Tax=Agaribacillus aureus TaxID=3051825 RepID=A0ABT8LHU3_9BACT|nr:paraquat-inducible protein A [Fulvivirgaceae bacterium BMA12]